MEDSISSKESQVIKLKTVAMEIKNDKDEDSSINDMKEPRSESTIIKDADENYEYSDDDDSVTVVKEQVNKEEHSSDDIASCSSSTKDVGSTDIKQEQFDKNPPWWTPELTQLKSDYRRLKQRFHRFQSEKTIKEYRDSEKKYKRLLKKCQPKDWKKREIVEVKIITKEDKEKREKQEKKEEKRKKKLEKYDFEGMPRPTKYERKKWGYAKNFEYVKFIRKEKQRENLRKYQEQRAQNRELPNGRTNLHNYP